MRDTKEITLNRVEQLLIEISFTQLADRDFLKRYGFGARTWNKALEQGLIYEWDGFFHLTQEGAAAIRKAAA